MNTDLFDFWTVAGGLLACGIALLLATLLVFFTYRVNTFLANRLQEEQMLLSGHRSVAIALGTVMLCQAILMRHAVFPVMAVLRDLLLLRPPSAILATSVLQASLFVVAVGLAAIGAVVVAVYLFTKLTGAIREREEILKDNVAVAIFFMFAMLSITLILNEGVEDLSRSLLQSGPSGIIRVP